MSSALSQLQIILRRDATDTTYKYALLRALIEIADEYEHHIVAKDADWVTLPLGLVIERWILYYFPLIEARLPQRNGANPLNPAALNIAFWSEMEKLIDRYRDHGGYEAFASDFKRGRLSANDPLIRPLLVKVRDSITDKPMRHLGVSVFKKQYQITRPKKDRPPLTQRRCSAPLDVGFLVANFGTFAVRRDFYEVFRDLGGFVTGTDAVIYQWAQFTAKAVRNYPTSVQEALGSLLSSPDSEREVREARAAYLEEMEIGTIRCVWSDRVITEPDELAIDHAVPFALWGNNDLWNLLPTHHVVNQDKRDKIPDPELVHRRRSSISGTWATLRHRFSEVFDREFHASLVGFQDMPGDRSWRDVGIEALASKCEYLITTRGFDRWII